MLSPLTGICNCNVITRFEIVIPYGAFRQKAKRIFALRHLLESEFVFIRVFTFVKEIQIQRRFMKLRYPLLRTVC